MPLEFQSVTLLTVKQIGLLIPPRLNDSMRNVVHFIDDREFVKNYIELMIGNYASIMARQENIGPDPEKNLFPDFHSRETQSEKAAFSLRARLRLRPVNCRLSCIRPSLRPQRSPLLMFSFHQTIRLPAR